MKVYLGACSGPASHNKRALKHIKTNLLCQEGMNGVHSLGEHRARCLAQRSNCRSLRDYKVWPPPAKYLERQGIKRQRAAFLLCCPAWQANCS